MTTVSGKPGLLPSNEANPRLDRNAPIPLYVQIKQRLLAMIATWDERDNRFYGDNELCQMFAVSRMTVRQAVRELVDDGFLTRVRGTGTFVAIPKIDEHFTSLMNLREQWASRGRPGKRLDPAMALCGARVVRAEIVGMCVDGLELVAGVEGERARRGFSAT